MTNRRKFLIGMGSLAAGSAAAVGSGAFTSVSANRDVEIDVEGDASAFLQITPAKEGESNTPNAAEYVETGEDGTVYLDFSNTDESVEGAGGSGLNNDATTIFDNLLDFTNQGTQDIEVGVVNDGSTPGSFYAENGQGNGQSDNTSFDVDDFGNGNSAQVIGPGEAIENVGFYITDPEDFSALDDGSFTVTFKAVRTGGNRD